MLQFGLRKTTTFEKPRCWQKDHETDSGSELPRRQRESLCVCTCPPPPALYPHSTNQKLFPRPVMHGGLWHSFITQLHSAPPPPSTFPSFTEPVTYTTLCRETEVKSLSTIESLKALAVLRFIWRSRKAQVNYFVYLCTIYINIYCIGVQLPWSSAVQHIYILQSLWSF